MRRGMSLTAHSVPYISCNACCAHSSLLHTVHILCILLSRSIACKHTAACMQTAYTAHTHSLHCCCSINASSYTLTCPHPCCNAYCTYCNIQAAYSIAAYTCSSESQRAINGCVLGHRSIACFTTCAEPLHALSNAKVRHR